ncbi:MAG: hypothetical protein RBS39_13705, partial [Phycisphaerales bacterium]|nr:hypothetical protein [Phycisphaerales bacterium]
MDASCLARRAMPHVRSARLIRIGPPRDGHSIDNTAPTGDSPVKPRARAERSPPSGSPGSLPFSVVFRSP